MLLRIASLIPICFLTIAGPCAAQSSIDRAFFNQLYGTTITAQHKAKTDNQVAQDKNELAVTGTVLYKVYRNLISSQDGSTCKFHPTCSAYCKTAMTKNGLILGGIQAIDRLTRCNGLSPQKYRIDIRRRKLVDHVH